MKATPLWPLGLEARWYARDRERERERGRGFSTWGRTAEVAAARRRSHLVSSAVPPCCTLCCSKWHHVAARTADLGGRCGKWRSRSRPRSRASVDPRATFGPGRRRSARRSCRSTRRRRRRSTWDSTAGPPSSRTAGHRAANRGRCRVYESSANMEPEQAKGANANESCFNEGGLCHMCEVSSPMSKNQKFFFFQTFAHRFCLLPLLVQKL